MTDVSKPEVLTADESAALDDAKNAERKARAELAKIAEALTASLTPRQKKMLPSVKHALARAIRLGRKPSGELRSLGLKLPSDLTVLMAIPEFAEWMAGLTMSALEATGTPTACVSAGVIAGLILADSLHVTKK